MDRAFILLEDGEFEKADSMLEGTVNDKKRGITVKKCKFCNKEVENHVVICPFCGKAIPSDENPLSDLFVVPVQPAKHESKMADGQGITRNVFNDSVNDNRLSINPNDTSQGINYGADYYSTVPRNNQFEKPKEITEQEVKDSNRTMIVAAENKDSRGKEKKYAILAGIAYVIATLLFMPDLLNKSVNWVTAILDALPYAIMAVGAFSRRVGIIIGGAFLGCAYNLYSVITRSAGYENQGLLYVLVFIALIIVMVCFWKKKRIINRIWFIPAALMLIIPFRASVQEDNISILVIVVVFVIFLPMPLAMMWTGLWAKTVYNNSLKTYQDINRSSNVGETAQLPISYAQQSVVGYQQNLDPMADYRINTATNQPKRKKTLPIVAVALVAILVIGIGIIAIMPKIQETINSHRTEPTKSEVAEIYSTTVTTITDIASWISKDLKAVSYYLEAYSGQNVSMSSYLSDVGMSSSEFEQGLAHFTNTSVSDASLLKDTLLKNYPNAYYFVVFNYYFNKYDSNITASLEKIDTEARALIEQYPDSTVLPKFRTAYTTLNKIYQYVAEKGKTNETSLGTDVIGNDAQNAAKYKDELSNLLTSLKTSYDALDDR